MRVSRLNPLLHLTALACFALLSKLGVKNRNSKTCEQCVVKGFQWVYGSALNLAMVCRKRSETVEVWGLADSRPNLYMKAYNTRRLCERSKDEEYRVVCGKVRFPNTQMV